jgi:hypothetical protein|tara:strand:+ start:57 stop:158 length:102 start_codon:yes stop_codon:yes gene_type:complete
MQLLLVGVFYLESTELTEDDMHVVEKGCANSLI